MVLSSARTFIYTISKSIRPHDIKVQWLLEVHEFIVTAIFRARKNVEKMVDQVNFQLIIEY